jgi:hypothetical protein
MSFLNRHIFPGGPMYVLKSVQGDYVTRIDRIDAAFGGGYSIFFSSSLSQAIQVSSKDIADKAAKAIGREKDVQAVFIGSLP